MFLFKLILASSTACLCAADVFICETRPDACGDGSESFPTGFQHSDQTPPYFVCLKEFFFLVWYCGCDIARGQ